MPKEVIQYGKCTESTHQDGTSEVVTNYTEPTLQVKWFNDPAHVQIQFKVDPGYLNELQHNNGFIVTSDILSRKEINHAIRILRRARDSAYGKDE